MTQTLRLLMSHYPLSADEGKTRQLSRRPKVQTNSIPILVPSPHLCLCLSASPPLMSKPPVNMTITLYDETRKRSNSDEARTTPRHSWRTSRR